MSTITEIERVSVTDLRTETASLMNRVCYGGERFVITSSGKERAALVSIGDLKQPSSLSHDELQEVIRSWLNDNFDGITWERVCIALAGENGLLGALGIAFTLPTRWIEGGLDTTPVPLIYASTAVRAKSPRPPTTHK